jgi:polar amino acid transport system substrate-binding protein
MTSCKSAAVGGRTIFANAQLSGTLRAGIANEKPYGYVDSNGALQGAMVELLKAVLAPYGITRIEAQIADFNSLVPSLLANRIDVIGAGMFIRPSRCDTVAFSDPVSRIGGSFLVKKGNPKNLHALKDVTRQPTVKIGTQPGVDQQEEVVRSGVSADQIVLFAKDTEALAGLQAGRVDAIYFPALEVNSLLSISGDASLSAQIRLSNRRDPMANRSIIIKPSDCGRAIRIFSQRSTRALPHCSSPANCWGFWDASDTHQATCPRARSRPRKSAPAVKPNDPHVVSAGALARSTGDARGNR